MWHGPVFWNQDVSGNVSSNRLYWVNVTSTKHRGKVPFHIVKLYANSTHSDKIKASHVQCISVPRYDWIRSRNFSRCVPRSRNGTWVMAKYPFDVWITLDNKGSIWSSLHHPNMNEWFFSWRCTGNFGVHFTFLNLWNYHIFMFHWVLILSYTFEIVAGEKEKGTCNNLQLSQHSLW